MNSKLPRVLIIIVVVIVSFIGGWFGNNFWEGRKQEQAKSVASDYIELILAGKTDDAYNMTTKQLQGETDIKQFKELYKGSELKDAKFDYTAVSKIEGKYVVYSFLTNLPKDSTGSTTGTFIVGLAKDDGKLKVESGVLQ